MVICGLAAFCSVSEAFVTPAGLIKGRGPPASLRDTSRRNTCGLLMQEQKAEVGFPPTRHSFLQVMLGWPVQDS